LRRGGRQRRIDERAAQIQAALRSEQLAAPDVVADAMGASVAALVAVITELNVQIGRLEAGLADRFEQQSSGTTRTATPTPSLARTTPARHHHPGVGHQTVVLARYARNRRLADACYLWAFAALTASPGARTFYDQRRAAGDTHHRALRALANRLVGILHGCLRHHDPYDEDEAWHRHRHGLSEAA